MKIRNVSVWTSVLLAAGAFLFATLATAQTPVAFQQRHFASHSDGSANANAIPCCAGAMTYDQRTVSSKHTDGSGNLLPGVRGGPYFNEFPMRRQYGTANAGALTAGGKRPITIPSGVFQTNNVLPLIVEPGGNLFAIETRLNRTIMTLDFAAGGGVAGNHITFDDITAMARAEGNNYFEYVAADHIPQNVPTFRTPGTYAGPNASYAGRIRVAPSPDQYGGSRNMIWDQLAHGWSKETPGGPAVSAAEFNFVVLYGPGVGIPATFGYNFTGTPFPNTLNTFMASDVIYRSTGSAPFTLRQVQPGPPTNPFVFTGPTIIALDGTGWFDWVDYTTGTVQVFANTIGTILANFSTRTEMGSYAITTTSLGAIQGQMQLVSGQLLNSRGASLVNLSHTHNTLIKFAPEPGSAALIGAGAIGLVGLAIRDRRRARG